MHKRQHEEIFLMKEGSELEEKKKLEGQKPTEGSGVIQMQNEAIEKLKGLKTRTYKASILHVKTVGGGILEVKGWTTEEEAKSKTKQQESGYLCDFCSREFSDRRRLAIHRNVHTKAEKEEQLES